jgi:hypothetical protein
MRTRRIGAAFRPGAAVALRREPFPGIAESGPKRGEALRSGFLSALFHASLLLLLLLVAYVTPAIRDEVLPVQIIKEEPPPPPPPPQEEVKLEPKHEEAAPAPKALAERRSLDFAPQAQAVAQQIVNPSVVAQAAPTVAAQKLEMNQVAQVVAPKEISHATVVAERVNAVDSVAVAQVAKVDVGATAAPALRGPADSALPSGASAGPRQIVTRGDTTGTGTAVTLGNTSSVREGIGSNRDVLGSPQGAPLANVSTRVGQGMMHGEGGAGTALEGGGSDDCLKRPEVTQYLADVRSRTYQRWVVGDDVHDGTRVQLRISLDPSGSLIRSEAVNAADTKLGQTAVDALRSAAPFAAMPPVVRCLSRASLLLTFTLGG